MAFRLLALAGPDPVKMEIKIAYPERDIMECKLVVIVVSVNAGKAINTRREAVEAISLMLFKSLILCVHLETYLHNILNGHSIQFRKLSVQNVEENVTSRAAIFRI